MKKLPCSLCLLATAGISTAAVTPITSAGVTVDTVPAPDTYLLQSVTVGSKTYFASNMANGTSTGNANQGAVIYQNITNIDNKDLNLFAPRNTAPAIVPSDPPTVILPPSVSALFIQTMNFGGGTFTSVATAPTDLDFFVFEAAGGTVDPDNVAVAPIYANPVPGEPDLVGQATDLLQTGWGPTGQNINSSENGSVNNGQPIVGIGWKITDMKDAAGNALASDAVIKGIAIVNSTANTQAAGLDPCALLAVTSNAPPPTPGPVAGLQVTAFGNQTVTLSWTPGIPGNTYSVYRSTTSGDYGTTPVPIGTTDATTFTYTDTAGLVNDTPYFYVVTQTNSTPAESAFSNEVTATPTSGVIAPTGLVALNAGNNAVSLDWATPITPFDSFNVYRSSDGGVTFSPVPSGTGVTTSEFLDLSVSSETTYIYKVTAVLNNAESPDSATASAIPLLLEVFGDVAGGTPSGRGVLGAGPGNIWNDVGGGTSVATTKLNSSTGVLTSIGIAGTSNFAYGQGTGAHVGGSPATLTGADLDIMSDYRFSDGGTIRNYTFSGFPPNRRYDLYLFGYGVGVTENSGFRTGGIAKQTTDPTGLTALTQTRHYVTFTVESDASGTFTLDWSGPGNLGLTDAHPGASTGFSGFQLVENANAVLQPKNPSAFGTLADVEVVWESVDGATSYKVYRSTTQATGYNLLADAGNNTIYNDTSAVPGTPYFYVVTALNGTVESFFSAETSGTRERPPIVDADLDGLSDEDEALIGTNPNDPSDFFVAPTSSVTPNAGNFNVAFAINGAPGAYVIERSTTLEEGSWAAIPASSQNFIWSIGTVLDNTLNLSATGLTPAPGGKEFFRAKGVAPSPPP